MKKVEFDLIIRNGTIVTHESIYKADIGIKDQRIKEISEKISSDRKSSDEIDASGLYILPGLIDTHVHFNEPGRTDWEGFETGTRSLAAGGVTTFFDMPLNNDPPLINDKEFKKKKECADKKSLIDYYLWGGLVPDNLDELDKLKECGVIGFKGFMSNSGIGEFSYIQDNDLLEGMKKIAELDSILALHAENESICASLAKSSIKEGRVSIRDYVASRPVISEAEAIMRATTFAEVTNCKVHILHVSSGEAIKYVSDAKQRGVDITVETCPHYLSLNIDDFEKMGAIAKCAPPLRQQEHVESLWRAIENGEIDTVGSDHSPAPSNMKSLKEGENIFDAWGGISGAQSTLAVLLEEGYFKRGIPLETIVRISSFNPAKRFNLYPQKGSILPGSDADLVLLDLEGSFTLKEEDLLYRHKHSPYVGRQFRGVVHQTILKGKSIWEKGSIQDNDAEKEHIDKQDKEGRTQLMLAVMDNNYPLVKELLEKGANPNIRDNTLLSPWLCAGANGFHEILEAMLDYGPDISSTNRFGGTVLLPSSEKGYLKTVELGLEAGVPVNHVNDLGWSALQEAAILGNGGFLYRDILKKLMLHGADTNLKDNEGKTATDWAKSRDEHGVVDILEGKLDANYQEARKLIQDEKYYDAIELLGEANSLEECYLMGHCYTLLKRYEDALAVYKKASEMDGGLPEFLFYSAKVLRSMKRAEEALKEYDKAINLNPEYFFYRYHKSNYLRELGRHEQAVDEMDELLSRDHSRYDYLFHKANSLRSLGRHREAIEAMDKAIDLDPKNPLYASHKVKSIELINYENKLR